MTISRRLRLGLLGFVVAAVIATPGLAGGNSDYASRCIDWQALYRTDGTPFDNQGACVSYSAHGGTPTAAFLHLDQAPCPATGFLADLQCASGSRGLG